MTPALLAHINQTYNRDPSFANLMLLAGASKATTEELRTLGSYIQLLARDVQTSGKQHEQYLSSSSNCFTISPDLVIEFSENRNDRWFLPKDSLICNPQGSPGLGEADISLQVKLSPKWFFINSDEEMDEIQHPDDTLALISFYNASASIKSVMYSRFNRALSSQVGFYSPTRSRQFKKA